MRHSSFWLFLDQLPTFHSQIEILGEPDFLVRLFQELINHGSVEASLHSTESLLDNPYIWSQNSLFDSKTDDHSPIIIFGKMTAKEQKEILPKLPKNRGHVILSEKKCGASVESCYYRPPTLQQWADWTLKLTKQKPSDEHFSVIVEQPWVMFDHWQQLRLLGSVMLEFSPVALSPDAWKKFAQLRHSQERGALIQTQDWHQILYCCEMIHQRALSTSGDKIYIPTGTVSPKLFDSKQSRASVNESLLIAYQKMVQASLQHQSEDFLWALSQWFYFESLI